MKEIAQLKQFGDELLLDLTPLSRKEIIELLDDLPADRLRIWLKHYSTIEAFEVCGVLKELIDKKSAT